MHAGAHPQTSLKRDLRENLLGSNPLPPIVLKTRMETHVSLHRSPSKATQTWMRTSSGMNPVRSHAPPHRLSMWLNWGEIPIKVFLPKVYLDCRFTPVVSHSALG